MKNILIRKENVGTLLYSQELCCYLLCNEAGEKVIEQLISNQKNGRTITEGIDRKYLPEIERIGVKENFRVLDYRNMTSRKIFVPLEYYFDFTNKCNLKCEHCYNKKYLGLVTMPEEDVTAIIEEMYELGIMRLHLAGGEPTIEKNGILNYVGTANRLGIVTSMATNGTLLTDEMCEGLIQNNMFAISVSIDGYDEETNSFRRGSGFFQKAVEGTKRLVAYRDKYHKPTEICVKPIYTYDTAHEYFIKMIELAIELGVDKIKFANPERSLNHEIQHYSNELHKYYENMEFVSQLQEKYAGQIKITNVNNPIVGCFNVGLPGMQGCIGSQELLTINPDGRITPCLMNDTHLGNYYDTRSIKEFLQNSHKLTEYQESIKNEACYSCDAYSMCRGGCQVRKIVEYGQIEKEDPSCPKKFDSSKIKKPFQDDFELFDMICVAHSL